MNETWISYKKTNILSYLAISLLLTACGLPELDSDAPTALVEISPTQIEQAIAPELNKVSLNQIKVGDMVEYKTTYVAETGDINPLEDVRRTVKKADWDSDPAVVVMDYKLTDHFNSNKSFERDEIWEFANSSLNSLAVKALESFFPLDDDEPVFGVKYYNLTSRRRIITPPSNILNKSNCGGLNGCNIEAIEVNYLVHLIKNGEVIERQERTESISHEIPALFVVDTQDPNRAMYPVAQSCNRFIFEGTLVNMCTTISDVDIK